MSMDSDEEKIEGLHEDSNQESGEDEASDLVSDLSQLSPEELRQYIESMKKQHRRQIHQKDQEKEKLIHLVQQQGVQLTETKAELKESKKSFLDGLPVITSQDDTTSYSTGTGIPCSFITEKYFQSTFESADFLPVKEPTLWRSANKMFGVARDEVGYANVTSALIDEIIAAMPVFREENNRVCIYSEKALSNQLRPDFQVIKNADDIPFFVIEIKKPLIFDRRHNLPSIYGQMFDYLFTLRSLYGVQNPYGVISTYKEYKICWLPDTFSKRKVIDEDDISQSVPCVVNDGNSEMIERILCVSKETWKPFADGPLGQNKIINPFAMTTAIASALSTAFNSPVVSRSRTGILTGPFKVFTPTNMQYRTVRTNLCNQFPSANTRNFFILDRFHPGIEGKAFHVFTAQGEQGVLKFIADSHKELTLRMQLPNTETVEEENSSNTSAKKLLLLEKESKYWKVINGLESRLVTANGSPALLMPYLEPLSKDDKNDPEIYKQVAALYESCADKGYFQSDAAWRHIGWYKYGDTRTVKLLDFGHVKKFAEPDTSEAFQVMKQEMAAEMLEMLGPAPAPTTAPTPAPAPAPENQEVNDMTDD